MKRILIIEDDHDIQDLVTLHLRDLNYQIENAFDGESGLEKAMNESFDLIIIDIGLPGELNGFDVCKAVRAENLRIPIFMLTARTEEIDRILGLEIGADDYITKPFSVRELVARVKAMFRRTNIVIENEKGKESETIIHASNIRIDLLKRDVQVDGESIELTTKEFDLLSFLMSKPGVAFTRMQLLDKVWGYQFEGYDHTVHSHINRLRKKIEENPSKPKYIMTVRGIGYKFSEE